MEHYDVVVLGAGAAGLNAAAVASQYLGQTGRLLLVDQRPSPGGMWNDTYDYVRLHQPHPFFTAGDIRWNQGHRPEHLAAKGEVLDHWAHCLAVIGGRTGLETRFGNEYVSHREHDGIVEVTLRGPDGTTSAVTTDRLAKAFGWDVPTLDPLPTSSTQVRSVSPDHHDMRTAAISQDSAPVWVVGGGKTGMDTALALLRDQPDRDVRMLVGGGTSFMDRDTFFPAETRRRVLGRRPNQQVIAYTLTFDGTNESDVQKEFLTNGWGHSPVDAPRDFMLGLMSRDEVSALRSGMKEFAKDYFEDVIDSPEGPQLVLRSGDTRPVPEGTWLVNCTGYVMRSNAPYEPFSSPTGRVLSINSRSGTTHLTTFAAYYLTHMMMRGKLPHPELYELDMVELTEKAKPAIGVACLTLTLHNISVFFEALPVSVFQTNQLDFDKWAPAPRVLGGAARFAATHKRMRARQRRALDALGARGIRSGPLG